MKTPARARKVPIWVREALITVALAAAFFFIFGVIQREGQRGGGGDLPVGAMAETFSLTDLTHGSLWSLEAMRGKPVILNFWATWCGVCRGDMPELEAFWRTTGDRFRFATISAEEPGVLRRFAAERGLSLPILHDPRGAVAGRYKVDSYPTVVIIDAEGRLVHDFSGSAHVDILEEHMQRLGAPPR